MKMLEQPNVFALVHKDITVSHIQTDNEEDLQQYVAVISCAVCISEVLSLTILVFRTQDNMCEYVILH